MFKWGMLVNGGGDVKYKQFQSRSYIFKSLCYLLGVVAKNVVVRNEQGAVERRE